MLPLYLILHLFYEVSVNLQGQSHDIKSILVFFKIFIIWYRKIVSVFLLKI